MAAFTESGSNYPAYVNISADGDRVRFVVRSPSVECGRYPMCGDTGAATFSRADAIKVLQDALAELTKS